MSETQSSDYWIGVRDDLWDLGIAVARDRLIDVETAQDPANSPDVADLRAGQTRAGDVAPAIAGMTLGTWMLIGAVVVVGAFVLKRVL